MAITKEMLCDVGEYTILIFIFFYQYKKHIHNTVCILNIIPPHTRHF